MAGWAEMITSLRKAGVEQLRAPYIGGGDSGDVEYVEVLAGANLPSDLEHDLMDLAWASAPVGFENNEGGQGEVLVDAVAGTVHVEHTDNYDEYVESSPEVITSFEWPPHDMALVPLGGLPYPWLPSIDWTIPVGTEYGPRRDFRSMGFYSKDDPLAAAALARFFRAFDPERGVRLLNEAVYGVSRKTDRPMPPDVVEAFLDAWETPPLAPRPLPPVSPAAWALLVLRIVGGREFRATVPPDGDEINVTVYGGDRSEELFYLPAFWTYPLGEALVEAYEIDEQQMVTVFASDDVTAMGTVYTRDWGYEEAESEVQNILVFDING